MRGLVEFERIDPHFNAVKAPGLRLPVRINTDIDLERFYTGSDRFLTVHLDGIEQLGIDPLLGWRSRFLLGHERFNLAHRGVGDPLLPGLRLNLAAARKGDPRHDDYQPHRESKPARLVR